MLISKTKPLFSARFGGARAPLGRSGLTLVEMMVAVAIIGIGILGMLSAFRYIITSMSVSQRNTLATNLAQQQIEILKNQGYYDLLITTDAVSIPGISAINGNAGMYDPDNYPPQSFKINGQTFTVYSYVAMLAMGSNDMVNLAGLSYPDTGLKGVQVNVVWNDRGTNRVITLTNMLENPNIASLDSGISGTITAPGVGNIAGALVRVDQHPSWFGYTNSAGAYSFSVAPGSWTVEASSAGYYSNTANASCNANAVTSGTNIALTVVATGTVGGSVWYNSGPVISQVVGTTSTWANLTGGGPFQANVEYVELFNPTTYQINMSPASPNNTAANEYFYLNMYNGSTQENDVMNNSAASCLSAGASGGVYVSTYIAPGGYFLFANYPKILVNGSWLTADAYYNNNHALPHDPNCVADLNWGAIQLKSVSGTVYDQVCWNGNGGPPSGSAYCNGGLSAYVPTDGTCGLNTGAGGCSSDGTFAGSYEGDQLVRFSSPAVIGRGTFGSAYDSQTNSLDFIYPISGNPGTYGLQYGPYTVSNGTFPIISGIPATGSEVAATDLFSGSTETVSATVVAASRLAPWNLAQTYSSFTLVGVTTGTWSIDVATADGSNNVAYYGHVDNITVNQGALTMVPNSLTTASWPYSNVYSLIMSSTASVGFVKGQVTDANLQAIGSPYIYVQGSGQQKLSTNGYYFLTVSTGTVAVTANPDNQNSSYTEQSDAVVVSAGQVAVQDFQLSRAGMVYGYVKSGSTAVPQVVVVALDSSGNQAGQATTDSTGEFYLSNITTGTFTVEPALPTGTSSSPGSTGATVTSSAPNVFVGTFTLTGALATFAGTVTYNGTSLISGALIIMSTGTIATPPNRILGSNANTQTPIYAISSLADGSFSLPVEANSNPYNVLVSMPMVNPNGTITMHTNTYAVTISTPSTTVSRTLSVP